MSKTIWIKNIAWAILWDESAGEHVYQRKVEVVFQDDKIVYIGPEYSGDFDEVIEGDDLLVMPGLINIHSHAAHEPAEKGVREEHYSPKFHSGLYERMASFWMDADGYRAAAEVAYCELLKSGVTTVVDWSVPFVGWIDAMAKSGLRGYITPEFVSSTWKPVGDGELGYLYKEDGGSGDYEACLRIIEAAENHESGRLSGAIGPGQIDTCSEELLRDSFAVAQSTDRPFMVHIAQLTLEFHSMVEQYGRTPIQYAHDLGLLGPTTVLGHAIFIDEHSSIAAREAKVDLDLIAQSGSSVAHCPTGFARGGIALESIARYRSAGINLGIGTDQSPHNLIEEMRAAIIAGRMAGDNMRDLGAAEGLRMATVGGAKALNRNDLGKLAEGMKADIVLVDLADISMRPVRDPLLNLIYHAADRGVKDVYVNGEKVLGDGVVLTIDNQDSVRRLEEAQRMMLGQVQEFDYAGRTIDEMAPLSLPLRM
jgi:cytosine/adenosine deaminase-related metal-dependent hydrolase